jgi:hypothetical protein
MFTKEKTIKQKIILKRIDKIFEDIKNELKIK